MRLRSELQPLALGGGELVMAKQWWWVFVWESRVGWTRRPLSLSPYCDVLLHGIFFGRGGAATASGGAGTDPGPHASATSLSLRQPHQGPHRKMPCPTTTTTFVATRVRGGPTGITSRHVMYGRRPKSREGSVMNGLRAQPLDFSRNATRCWAGVRPRRWEAGPFMWR